MVDSRDIDWTPTHVENRGGFGRIAVIAIFVVAVAISLMFGLGVWRIA